MISLNNKFPTQQLKTHVASDTLKKAETANHVFFIFSLLLHDMAG